MFMRITTGLLVALAIAFPTGPASADEASEFEVFSAPGVRSPVSAEGDPGSAQPRRAAKSTQTLGRTARHALVIDLGPLPIDLSPPAEEEDTGTVAPKRYRIGVHRPLPREFTGDLVPHLDWTADPDGRHTATITFRAAGAVSLRLAVQATLPSGASVQVFDGDGQPRGSAFTPAAFNASEKRAGMGPPAWLLDVLPLPGLGGGANVKFHASPQPRARTSVWLPSVEGDTLTVQIVLPSAEAVEALSFRVPSVAHRFASVVPQSHPYGDGLCQGHVDLACVQSQLVHDVARTVGRIEFEAGGSTYACTGTLLATAGTPDVYEPYFLTANHCVGTDTVAATVEALWLWQGAICEEDEDPPLQWWERERAYGLIRSYEGTDLLATSPTQDSTLLLFKERLPGGLWYSGWTDSSVRNDTSVFTVHHSRGDLAKYAEGRVNRTVTTYVGENLLHNAFEVDWSRGLTEPGSSGAGLFDGGQLVGVLSGVTGTCILRGQAFFGPFHAFFSHIRQWLVPEPETFTHTLPAVPGAGGDIQGFVRIMNFDSIGGEVEIYATDDTGQRYGPVTLALGADQTRHFNSEDLEHGAPSKELIGGVGDGTGMWRLELKTPLSIVAWAYIRTPDGFVTSMHQLAEVEEYLAGDFLVHLVPFFNPGSNAAIRSLLRVINPNATSVVVAIAGRDDDGRSGATAYSLAANSAMQISSQALEHGWGALEGHLGDGEGKWSLVVLSIEEESYLSGSFQGGPPIHVMSLLSTASGHLTNLSR